MPRIQHISDTAYWMASYRAMEGDRKDALFCDPLAKLLVGEYGKKVSDSMKPFSRYAYWTLVIRTRVIDKYILKYASQGYKTIVNLGAGLDTRPYRLDLPKGTQWVEIDFPEIIKLKNEKLKNENPKCDLERIGADLSNQVERQKIFADLNGRVGATLILTEGVIPYLTESLVCDLATDLKRYSNFKLWIAEYHSPLVYARFQSPKFSKLLGDSPFQFFPADWLAFLERCGWSKKEMRYLYDEAEKLGRKFPLPWWASLLMHVIGKQKIIEKSRVSAYIVYERKTGA
jgi:methyltransferase (TIGR00027 family)